MKRRYALMIRGKRKEWSFPVWAEPEHVEEWRADGLIVDEVLNVIPQWAVDLGLARIWVWVQDLLWGNREDE